MGKNGLPNGVKAIGWGEELKVFVFRRVDEAVNQMLCSSRYRASDRRHPSVVIRMYSSRNRVGLLDETCDYINRKYPNVGRNQISRGVSMALNDYVEQNCRSGRKMTSRSVGETWELRLPRDMSHAETPCLH